MTSKLFIATNNMLNFDHDGGMARRLKQQHFRSEFHQDFQEDDVNKLRFKKDTRLQQKIVKHYKHAILAILYDFACDYLLNGKLKPEPAEWAVQVNES